MDTIALISKAHKGDKAAREQLVMDNLGLIWSIVKRFTNRGYEAEDLFQIGSIGLIKAIDKFDESFDVKFSTYAVPMITGEIKRFLRDDGMIKISRSIKENQAKVMKTAETLMHKNGREATINEIAKESGLDVSDVVAAMDAAGEVESLHKVIHQGENNEISLMDKIEDDRKENEIIINKIFVSELLEKLSEEEKNIIIMRYYDNLTQNEIAKNLGVSQVQVSRMEKKILLRLRKNA